MMQRTTVVLFLLLGAAVLAACSGGTSPAENATQTDVVSATTAAPTTAPPTSEPPVATEPPTTSAQPPVALSFTEPVVFEAHDLDLSRLSVRTTVYSLTADPGTQWELPIQVPVPIGWEFDPTVFGFTDGASSIVFTTGCSDDCGPTDWNTTLFSAGGFLAEAQDELGSSGFSGGGSFGDQQNSSVHVEADDGTGAAATAIYNVDSGRYLGCTTVADSASAVTLDGLRDVCRSVVVDWTTAIASTPVREISEVLTDSAARINADPAPGIERQTIQLEDGDEFSADIALPADATVGSSFFGVEVDLGGDFSIFSDLSLNTGCDGLCVPQDWFEKLNDNGGLLGATRLSLDIDNDSPIDSGWLISGSSRDGYEILVVRWNDKVDMYFSCSVDLDEDDVEHSDAALGYCLSARPNWITW